jgi:hypothetical protein
MHTQFRRMAVIAALTIGASAVATIPAMGQEQEHRDATTQRQNSDNRPDYSNNRYYRLGNQEGLQDHGRNKQRTSHKHKYGNDDDRRAHDYGYHEGWEGRNYRDADHDHDRDQDHGAYRDPH